MNNLNKTLLLILILEKFQSICCAPKYERSILERLRKRPVKLDYVHAMSCFYKKCPHVTNNERYLYEQTYLRDTVSSYEQSSSIPNERSNQKVENEKSFSSIEHYGTMHVPKYFLDPSKSDFEANSALIPRVNDRNMQSNLTTHRNYVENLSASDTNLQRNHSLDITVEHPLWDLNTMVHSFKLKSIKANKQTLATNDEQLLEKEKVKRKKIKKDLSQETNFLIRRALEKNTREGSLTSTKTSSECFEKPKIKIAKREGTQKIIRPWETCNPLSIQKTEPEEEPIDLRTSKQSYNNFVDNNHQIFTPSTSFLTITESPKKNSRKQYYPRKKIQ